jgi:hypothetical protein
MTIDFWMNAKTWMVTETALPDSTLHSLFGMLLLVLGAALLRRMPWHWGAWLFVLALELINEAYDMLNPDSGENNLGASLHDIWLTMFSPTLLLVAMPLLIRWAAGRPSADSLEQPLE